MRYGISTREDGSMSLTRNLDNRAKYFDKRGLGKKKIIASELVHGNAVALVNHSSENLIPTTDGLVTREEGIVLTVTVADCYPVYFFDQKNGVIGLAHIGWQGAAKSIVRNILAQFDTLESTRRNIRVIIGPGICATHYPVPRERAAIFMAYPETTQKIGGQAHLDIKNVIVSQLEANGVTAIEQVNECTYELSDRYFSYRRGGPDQAKRQVAWISMS